MKKKNKSAIWDTMSVEDKHIMEGTPDSCVDCPIALAMKDYEPVFDEMTNYKPNINTGAEDWLGEDSGGAMSHRIIVHPDDRETVEQFIREFDGATDNPYNNNTESYYEWDTSYRTDCFVPFTFRYRVVLWTHPRELTQHQLTQGE